MLTITVVARGVEDINKFMENLEATGAFRSRLDARGAHERQTGQLRGRSLETIYLPTVGQAGAAPEARDDALRRGLRREARVVLPLVIALLLNVLAYVLVVRPLRLKSAGAADRAAARRGRARGGRARHGAAARRWWPGKRSADEELTTFYQHVLPATWTRRGA